MDAGLAWTVVGSVAGVVAVPAAAAGMVWQVRQSRRGTRTAESGAVLPGGLAPAAGVAVPDGQGVQAGDRNVQVNVFTPAAGAPDARYAGPVVAGEVPGQPPGWQPRPALLAALDQPGADGGVMVVRAVTGMRGVGKTQLAAAYARTRIGQRWRLVAWINAETDGTLLAGLADTAAALGLAADDAAAAGRAVRHWLETGVPRGRCRCRGSDRVCTAVRGRSVSGCGGSVAGFPESYR